MPGAPAGGGMDPPGIPFDIQPAGINAARAAGRLVPIHNAQAGDLVCFDWDDDNEADHIGLVEINAADGVNTIEFNTSPGSGGAHPRSRGENCSCH